jgi:hypothetical protein
MATGDGINVRGAFATMQASASTLDDAFLASAPIDVATAISGEQDYFLVDFQSVAGAGSTADGYLSVFKQTLGAPIPSTTHLAIYVGNMLLDATSGTYRLNGVSNEDPTDKYYVQNSTGGTVTLDLQVRGRTYNTAP